MRGVEWLEFEVQGGYVAISLHICNQIACGIIGYFRSLEPSLEPCHLPSPLVISLLPSLSCYRPQNSHGQTLDGGTIDGLIDFAQEIARTVRISEAMPSNREVEHVPAYSHSNRWVGVGGACSDKWIVIAEIRGSQGNRNYRRGPVRLAQRSRNESVEAASA